MCRGSRVLKVSSTAELSDRASITDHFQFKHSSHDALTAHLSRPILTPHSRTLAWSNKAHIRIPHPFPHLVVFQMPQTGSKTHSKRYGASREIKRVTKGSGSTSSRGGSSSLLKKVLKQGGVAQAAESARERSKVTYECTYPLVACDNHG